MIWSAAKAIGLKGFAIIALVLFVATCWNRWGAWEKTAHAWQETASKEKQARKGWQNAFEGQKANYRAAQETARRIALAEKERDIRNYQMYARRADNAEAELVRYRAAAERYARANRVRNTQAGAPRRDAGAAGPAGPGDPAQGDNRPGGDAVVVDRVSFDQLVVLATRAKAAHDWGNDLLAAGLAEKAE